MKTLHLIIAALLIFCGVILPQTLAEMQVDYRWTGQYLSELGATGAPHAGIMNNFGFLPAGVLWAAALFLLIRRVGGGATFVAGALLLMGTSISYIGAYFFPCDLGCPIEGSEKQFMHNTLGLVGYLTAPFGFVLVASQFFRSRQSNLGALSALAAVLVSLGFLMMASAVDASLKGAWQRLADFTLFFWLLAVAWNIKDVEQPTT
ncbi:MAG: DUF998 domain-containing protein [Marinicaulis sp.]|nr:DUF998 domain-containing protein [Marinicaulis sp.]